MTMPWDSGAMIRLYLVSFLGFTLVMLGWYQTSGTAKLSSQLGWVNVAGIGLIVAGTGNVLWLVHGHRAVRGRQRNVLSRISAITVDEPAVIDNPMLVSVTGTQRSHRPDCPLVAGKNTVVVSAGVLRACETCLR